MVVERLRIEVVYALPAAQQVVVLEVPAGTSLRNAVERSRLLDGLDAGEVQRLRFGIHGALMAPETLLRDGDRVEIYRPLQADPKAIRRRRAKRGG